MKINEKNTAIHFLSEGDPIDFGLVVDPKDDKMKNQLLRWSVKDAIVKLRQDYKQRIRFLSDPFLQAYERAKDRLKLDLVHEEMSETGTFITRRDDGLRNTLFYRVNIFRDEAGACHIKGSLLCFGSDKRTNKPVLYCKYMKGPGQPIDEYMAGGEANVNMSPFGIFIDIVYILLFLKYCPLETKVIEGGRKADHIGTKYINDTKSAVEVVDSTWFTTIIRSEGFGVRGHFRMQPCGPGLNERKLIYVRPFEKHGYTRRANIERQ